MILYSLYSLFIIIIVPLFPVFCQGQKIRKKGEIRLYKQENKRYNNSSVNIPKALLGKIRIGRLFSVLHRSARPYFFEKAYPSLRGVI